MPSGGKRAGAVRPVGSQNVDTAASRQALADLASGHVGAALEALADIAINGRSEAARVSAACAILDRCYGRPRSMPFSAPLIGVQETDLMDQFSVDF